MNVYNNIHNLVTSFATRIKVTPILSIVHLFINSPLLFTLLPFILSTLPSLTIPFIYTQTTINSTSPFRSINCKLFSLPSLSPYSGKSTSLTVHVPGTTYGNNLKTSLKVLWCPDHISFVTSLIIYLVSPTDPILHVRTSVVDVLHSCNSNIQYMRLYPSMTSQKLFTLY